MYRDIEEKRKRFLKDRPDDPAFASWEEESALWGWLFSTMRLLGTPLEKGQIVSIMRGEILEDVPLERYGFLHRYRDVYRDIRSGLDMELNLSASLIDRYCDMLFDKPAAYRDRNPVVYEWSYNPPHFSEVPEQMELLLRRHARRRREADPVTAMAEMHLGMLEIYPYGEDTLALAGVALLFEIQSAGLPAGSLFVSEQEYHSQIASYLRTGHVEPFREMLMRSLINRLDVLLQACEAANEQRQE